MGPAIRIPGSLRRIRRRIRAAKNFGLRPGPEATDKSIDLFVGKHSAGTLCKGWHRSAGYSVCGYTANGGIISYRQENRVAQRDRCSCLTAGSMASSTVLSVENIEIHDPVGRDHLRTRPA